MTPLKLADIAKMLNCPLPAGADTLVTGVAMLTDAGPNEVSFLGSDAYINQFLETRAAAVITSRKVKIPDSTQKVVLRVENADLAVAQVLERFAPPIPRPAAGVDFSAKVHATVTLGAGAAVGALAVIGARSKIGPDSIIHPGVIIGEDVSIGRGCEIFHNVVIRERVTLGDRVIINAGSVLGTDGFGYRWDGSKHVKIPQIGTIVIEDDVEIGSCVCIDRAKFSATRIGEGTKIDNLVQIGHNVVIGPHCIIVGQAGIAGSSKLGTGVVLGGQVAVRDHVTLGDGSSAAACSGIANDIKPNTIVSGTPALPHRQNLREQAALRRLPALLDEMRKLQAEVEELKKRTGANG